MAQPGPLLPQRTVLVFIAALVIGIATGTLTYLAYHLLAEAVLAGGAAAGTAIPTLHKLIDEHTGPRRHQTARAGTATSPCSRGPRAASKATPWDQP